ncbi:MAG: hypothetical protein MK137_08650, partial [Rickettsiales bacterium]|nr:hypothetical protein [Rickettsiales bacterium]
PSPEAGSFTSEIFRIRNQRTSRTVSSQVMETLKTHFNNRDELIAYVKEQNLYAKGEASSIIGGLTNANDTLHRIDPINYGNTRNFGNGKITKLSPYVHHGIIDLNHIRNHALDQCSYPQQIKKFIQELAWRDFWQRVAEMHPEWLWHDIEPYKTGFEATDYADELPDDIANGHTGIASLDAFIHDLIEIGYVHNHARMYLASYVVHFRRVKWQAGAKWFLEHLLDGDEASNNFSWQWVASTFSNKPYIFNLENVDKYFSMMVDTSAHHNTELDASYEILSARLFPKMGGLSDDA